MKRMIVVMAVLAVVIAALAPSVSAQSPSRWAYQDASDTLTWGVRGTAENLCEAHRGTGDAVEASWCHCAVIDRYGRVEGYNPNCVDGLRRQGFRVGDVRRIRRSQQYGNRGYGYRYHDDYYYDNYGNGDLGVNLNGRTLGTVLGGVAGGVATRHNRSGLVQAGAILAGGVLGNIVGGKFDNRNDYREARGVDPSECVRDTLKEFRKRHVAVSADQVIALCGGSNIAAPAPHEIAEDDDPETQTEASPAPRTEPKSVYITKDKQFLCNNTDKPISVYVNGKPIGRLAAGQIVALSSLPAGKVEYFPIN